MGVATAAQLAAQLKRLKEFTSRDTQFVGDVKKRPIPKSEWVEYKAAETVYNKRVAQEFESIKNTVLPSGETVGQRAAKMKADHAMAGNPSVTPPHNAWTRQPFNIKNRAALKKLTDDARHKMSPEYDKEELKRQQDEMRQVLAMIKNPELEAGIDALTNRQFNILWNYSSFANEASLWYEMVKLHGQGDEESWHGEIIDQKFAQALELVKSAKDW